MKNEEGSVELFVYPTHRNIRQKYQEYSDDILPKCMTMDEFEKRVVVVEGKSYIDEDKRVLLLKKATGFSQFDTLKIPRDYLSFLKSSKFLFSFFEELSLEQVDIDSIDKNDTYAEYATHLNILKILLNNYTKLLEADGYFDKITLPKLHSLNKEFLQRFSKITLYIDGYLNSFEFELLQNVSKYTSLNIVYQTNEFAGKMVDKFKSFGINLEDYKEYVIDFSNKKIQTFKNIPKSIKRVEYSFVSSKIMQVGFVKKKVYDFLQGGLKPEDIIVITPDEEFALLLEKFDENNIFNFAAGFSYKKSDIYQRVRAVYNYLEDKSYENSHRVKRFFNEFEKFDEYRYKKFDKVEFDSVMMEFVFENDIEEEVLIYKNELFKFKRVESELKDRSFKDALYLFLERVKNNRIDDKNGGKITVMGLLETRLAKFDGVIVVDFNEDMVPKRSSKDLFLNSSIRKRSGLPTPKDRENLQKNYYFKLFLNAKEIALSAVQNENEKPSYFLDELHIENLVKSEFDDNFLKTILIKKADIPPMNVEKDIYLEYDFKNFIFSATSFKIFLECKRRFYFQYIKKIKEAQIPQNEVDEREIGEKLHFVLENLFKTSNSFSNELQMQKEIDKLLNGEKNPLFRFKLDIWRERLKSFVKNEIKRFDEGYRFYKGELKLYGNINGYKISGKIDRVDIKEGRFVLLDYKTGKINLATSKTLQNMADFQMEFYYLLAKQNGFDDIDEVAFYDLSSGKILKETFLEDKLSLLEEKFLLLEEKEQYFNMSEDIKSCRYCPYTMLCGRDEI